MTLPVKEAVPLFFVIETVPVVVNPDIVWAAIVLVMTMGELPAVSVPPLFI